MHERDYVTYRELMDQKSKIGQDGTGEEVKYVPLTALREYWTPDRVREALDTTRPNSNHKTIIDNYIRVFSALVYAGMDPADIELLIQRDEDDHVFPRNQFETWRQTQTWNDFWDKQWRFFPLEFTPKKIGMRQLHVRRIIPMDLLDQVGGRLGGQGSAQVHLAHLHPECNTLIPKGGHVVCKVFQGARMKRHYDSEAQMYMSLDDEAHKSIPRFYGAFSYETAERRFILLENAKGGSLSDFFRDTSPPVSLEELIMFWERMSNLLNGAYIIHNLQIDSNRSTNTGIHNDIQPANILVFPSNNSEKNRFDVTFKLADFGASAMEEHQLLQKRLQTKDPGNRMYAAPECHANEVIHEKVKNHVTSSVDIWGLGAIFSDALIWSIANQPGRESYRQARKREIGALKWMSSNAFDACFHDGKDRLNAVAEEHRAILQNTRKQDVISCRISQVILDDMLVTSRRRLHADQIKMKFEEQIHRAQSATTPPATPSSRGSDMQSPSSPTDTRHPGPTASRQESIRDHQRTPTATSKGLQSRVPSYRTTAGFEGMASSTDNGQSQTVAQTFNGASKPSRKLCDVERIYQNIIEEQKRNRLTGILKSLVNDQTDRFEEPQGVGTAQSTIREEGGRDIVMLIDDSPSMKEHYEDVCKTARVISKKTKIADDDGIDLYYTSIKIKAGNFTTSKEVEKHVRKTGTSQAVCSMMNSLDAILKSKRRSILVRKKPLSIYIYTNGVWEAEEKDVSGVITGCIEDLAEMKLPPSTLMFQFIQFGQDNVGTARLNFLDNECKLKRNGRTFDIVDTKRWTDDVGDIMIGSILPGNDARSSQVPPPAASASGSHPERASSSKR